MKKSHSRAVLLFILLLLFVSITIGCGAKQPGIEGVWEADFWDGAYIKLAPQLKFFVYVDHDAAKNNDHYDLGEYRLYEQDGLNCFGFGKFEDASSTPTVLKGIIEYASDDHIILTLDEKCKWAQSKDWDPGVDVEKLNLKRIE